MLKAKKPLASGAKPRDLHTRASAPELCWGLSKFLVVGSHSQCYIIVPPEEKTSPPGNSSNAENTTASEACSVKDRQ